MAKTDKAPGLPRHVAIIMDGNGRWARQRDLPRVQGHAEGTESVRTIVRACKDFGIEFLTLYAFSVENWIRPEKEVAGLMELLVRFLKHEEQELHDNEVRLRTIGRTEDLPKPMRKELDRVIDATAHYDKGQLILALSYGGRDEIVHATRAIARRVQQGELAVDDITADTVSENLYAPDIPDPDLLIRTSGEMRISNFLLWQISYAEIYVTDVLWPDFREAEFKKALDAYAARERRFGDVKTR